MKKILIFTLLIISNLSCSFAKENGNSCLTGAFLADIPSQKDISNFKHAFGKKPYLVLLFLGWGDFLNKKTIDDVYAQKCVLLVTWEPWYPKAKAGIDFDGLLAGKFDKYIEGFALQLKEIKETVFLRFAQEPNGDWYPWSGTKIGNLKYISVYRHIHAIFTKLGVSNVRWVFSVNWEDLPKENNNFLLYYPGDSYVDYIGIDGYNWGNTQPWSRWMSFGEIFTSRYQEIISNMKKPVILSEFGSASAGGSKGVWIEEAMERISRLDKITGFVIFNVDKEADWQFKEGTPAAEALKQALKNSYFKDRR
jgi:beta-mannanase